MTNLIASSRLFTENQYEKAYPDGTEEHFWYISRRRIILELLNKFFLDVDEILDVGCGRGFTVSYLRLCGFQCWGSEISRPCLIDNETSQYVFTETSSLDIPHSIKSKIQTLLFLDVLEHIENPQSFLQDHFDTFPKLKNILITVPARQELWSNYDDYYGHYIRYNLITFNKIIEKLPVKVVDFGYLYHSLYFPARIISFFGLKRSTDLGVPHGIFKIFHRLLAKFFLIERRLLPKKLLGTSLYYCLNVV